MQFKKGDRVKVVRRSKPGEVYWAEAMDKSIGKVYRISRISDAGNLLLEDGFCYPPKGVTKINTNQQLLFPFMNKLRLSK